MTSGNHIATARGLEPAAAAIFAGACAFAAAKLWPGGGVAALAVAILCFVLAYGLSLAALLRVAATDARFALPGFAPVQLEPASDELLLDDALEPVRSNSRVVQLFAAGRAPTRHLPATPDETQALLRALSELRRSFH